MAHNGSRFDNIILMRSIFAKWGREVCLLGTKTNPKAILVKR